MMSSHLDNFRNLEKSFGGDVRVCDRTALILDIFNQRAATHEAALQVALAQMEYQLPRLTKMWTHLERQAGGKVKGMDEKQIEVDKRILGTQIGVLKKELESVRKHRKQYRNHRFSVPVPVVSLVGRVQMKNGSEFLLTDTVGFIQKLPTTLVAAFRATLEEISESSLLVHVVDISHPLAELQIDAVEKVLAELCVDRVSDPQKIKLEAERREDVVCISALTGEGLQEFCNAVQEKLNDSMVPVEALLPFDKGELLSTIHQVGMVEKTEYTKNGTFVKAFVPLRFARLLTPMRKLFALGVSGGFSVQHCPNTSVYRKLSFGILKDITGLDSNEWNYSFYPRRKYGKPAGPESSRRELTSNFGCYIMQTNVKARTAY
ncbi:hypothetical protein V6N11_030368 [Hibiscus sabdariffa]|uniref:Hflx-type G domain-containing protein n=1 Tax=Hibiscus sabdariffa TaxID=183260 RepID=A0ABR2PL19_9ROSI